MKTKEQLEQELKEVLEEMDRVDDWHSQKKLRDQADNIRKELEKIENSKSGQGARRTKANPVRLVSFAEKYVARMETAELKAAVNQVLAQALKSTSVAPFPRDIHEQLDSFEKTLAMIKRELVKRGEA